MKRIIAARELARGVFWVTDDGLLPYPFYGDESEGIAKSGNTFNHKKLWPLIAPRQYKKYTYNYFPRGRVDINNRGKVTIYLNPNIDDSYIPQIRTDFGITTEPAIQYDYSNHYKCHLDNGWKPDK